VIRGGSQSYVDKLVVAFRDRIRVGAPVTKVQRTTGGVRVVDGSGAAGDFDHVVFACQADQALRILGDDATATERELLGAFPYQVNEAVLHTDPAPLPARRKAWASWNYRLRKTPGGPAWRQDDINELLIEHARAGAVVARLKSGDPLVFGRADEEIEALEQAGVAVEIVPGITSAAAAAATSGRSLTRRGRNQSVTLMTAHDARGFAEHDWRALARPGAVAAVYMGVRAATFVRGRLLLHGAEPTRPVTVVENASRVDEKRVATTLGELPEAIAAAGIGGPAVILATDGHPGPGRAGTRQRKARQLERELCFRILPFGEAPSYPTPRPGGPRRRPPLPAGRPRSAP